MVVIKKIQKQIGISKKYGKLEFLENGDIYSVRIATPNFYYFSTLLNLDDKVIKEYKNLFESTIRQEEKELKYFGEQL